MASKKRHKLEIDWNRIDWSLRNIEIPWELEVSRELDRQHRLKLCHDGNLDVLIYLHGISQVGVTEKSFCFRRLAGFEHTPVQRTPAGFAGDGACHLCVGAVPAQALHVSHAVAADDAGVTGHDRPVLVLGFANSNGSKVASVWLIVKAQAAMEDR